MTCKVYVYVIKHKTHLNLVVMLSGKNDVKYVRYLYGGMDFGVHVVVID